MRKYSPACMNVLRSFAFGNANIENVRVTRQIVDEQADDTDNPK